MLSADTLAFVCCVICSYFFLQQTILQEAAFGIALSLVLAFVVLNMATANYIIASMATGTILVIVACVVGFTVMMGWKLGVRWVSHHDGNRVSQ